MSLCLIASGATKMLAISAFTLSWMHSVEKTNWEEDWIVTNQGLRLVEARVKGSGAGIAIPDNARLIGSWYRWNPGKPAMLSFNLRRSDAVPDWRMCSKEGCQKLGELSGVDADIVTLSACERPGG